MNGLQQIINFLKILNFYEAFRHGIWSGGEIVMNRGVRVNVVIPDNNNHNDNDGNIQNLNPINDEGVIPDVDYSEGSDIIDEENSDKLQDKNLFASISDEALQALNDLRCNDLLCDAIISVDDGSFNVHRVIMSSCSPYFR